MPLTEAFVNTILRRICCGAAWVIYHAVTLYDRTRALHAVFRYKETENVDTNHQFKYPPIRLHRYWHTTRLLQLSPGTGIEPLEGNLLTNVTIKLFSWAWTFGECHYHAISYCWGDSRVTKMIYLNGKLLPITETLHSALRSLRQQESPVVLWADQICIDQSQAALNERSSQVQRMGEIYANADNVIVWLGNPTKYSDEVFHRLNILDDLHRSLQTDEADSQTAHIFPENDIDTMISSMLEVTRGTAGFDEEGQVRERLRLVLDDLVNNAWFSRIWVLQEAALAKDLCLQAGSRRVPWRRFVACVQSLQDKADHPAENAGLVYDIELLRQQHLSEVLEDGDLLMMVETFRGRQATDIRDKIYGLFGLTTTASPRRAFHADYSKSPEQVFVEFALWHIQVNGNVRVLAKCCSEEVRDTSTTGSEQPRLPSWATDWSVTSSSDCSDLVDDSFLPKTGTQLYNASRSLRADARIIFEQDTTSLSPPKDSVLVLNGVIVDTVAEVVDRIHTWAENSDAQSATWLEWKRLALQERSSDPYGSRTGHLNAFWRTLVVDRVDMVERASPDISMDFDLLLGSSNNNTYHSDHLSETRDGISKSREGESGVGENSDGNFATWLKNWNSVHLGKRIFRTERGYLGISCEHAQKGDRVAILWGGRLPFLLREHGSVLLPGRRGRPSLIDDTVVSTYKLIGGECYVHGLADGEGLDIAERVGILPTKICLV
jgi:hypothetical protein